jgi:hypothetical protein
MTSIDIITSGEGNSHEGLRASETFKCHTPFLIRERRRESTRTGKAASAANEQRSDEPNLEQTLPEIDFNANYFFRSAKLPSLTEGKLPRIWYNRVSKARPDGRAFAFKDQGLQVQSPDLGLLF